jgi:hypothetical protein
MTTTIEHYGFPAEWPAGQLNIEVMNNIKKNIAMTWPNQINFIVNTAFMDVDSIKKLLERHPDNLFICSTTDPWLWFWPLFEMQELLRTNITTKIHRINYNLIEYDFDFWAICCLKFFKNYTVEDVELKDPTYLFLNYNRKPHSHRQALFEKIKTEGLDSLGIITIGTYQDQAGNCIASNLNETIDYVDTEFYSTKQLKIPNDNFSLGNINIWQSHFVNIVSESRFTQQDQLFLSEKIWKPIIGMRPFMVNVHHDILRHLQKNGFDTFEDLWPVPYKPRKRTKHLPIDEVTNFIVENLKWLQTQNLSELYQSIRPRLLANRQRFFEYAKEQETVARELFS